MAGSGMNGRAAATRGTDYVSTTETATDFGPAWQQAQITKMTAGLRAARELAGLPPMPLIVCLCGSTRFYDEFQRANYDLTMTGRIVLSVGFYPHAKAIHGHGEGVGHDSAEKVALDELHKRKIDLADYCLIVSDESGYFGESTAGEIRYAVEHGKPVEFAMPAASMRAFDAGLIQKAPF